MDNIIEENIETEYIQVLYTPKLIVLYLDIEDIASFRQDDNGGYFPNIKDKHYAITLHWKQPFSEPWQVFIKESELNFLKSKKNN